MPKDDESQTITRWGKQYGDVVRVSLLGRNVIFLNSLKAANDLLDKRSSNYSDRPELSLVTQSMGMDWNFGLMPYGNLWRRLRKVFTSKLGIRKAFVNYAEVQQGVMGQLLRRLEHSPEDFLDHLRLHIEQLMMKAVYGLHAESSEDHRVQNVHNFLEAFSDAARPVAYLVSSLPIIKHIPSLWPGVIYKRSTAEMNTMIKDMLEVPFADAKALIADGNNASSYVSDLLEGQEPEEDVKKTAAIVMGGGFETTLATATAFILAMVKYPEVQQKAQDEIDKVIGQNRLPTFEDRDSLPYVYAIFKETLRWHTVAPQGLPHESKEDDVYNGFSIPAKSTVMANIWGILHDPDVYPDPMDFKPERYFSSDGKLDFSANDPARVVFGFGRRICAGMFFAENSLWIIIAQILATMKISHAYDKEGREISVELKPMAGVVSQPSPFKCTIVPRSEQAMRLIAAKE
ncbi:cytochrome P450 [Schizopora paradoxa]|uniref:Cytochrome P450 n=1 Tax=Schizopora paradoxa TaxID=27342 RepID=A0A0H2SIN8_9AGAM|nr:cytochrome P450 [Schizopora paradoxa]